MSTTPVITPTTPTATTKCCNSCSSPRTIAQFLKHHVKTYVPTTPGDTCCICWNDFGSVDLETGALDIACQVTGLTGCSHILGHACLLKIVASKQSHCPLCREEWYFRDGADSPFACSMHASQKEEVVNEVANTIFVSLAAAGALIYEYEEEKEEEEEQVSEEDPDNKDEDEAQDKVGLQTFFSNLEDLGNFLKIKYVMGMYEDFDDFITSLQDNEPNPTDERLYDPYTNTQEMFDGGDVWRFRNWHKSSRVLAFVAFCALSSPNGQRLHEWYALDMAAHRSREEENWLPSVQREDLIRDDEVVGGQDKEVSGEMLPVQSTTQVLESLEDRWVEWYGEEEVRVFSRFLINVLEMLFRRRGWTYYC